MQHVVLMRLTDARRCFALVGAASLWLLLLSLATPTLSAATTVRLGSVQQISGPGDLDLEGDFPYAINFSNDDPVRTVRGVRFLPDNRPITGATLVGPQNVTPWQTKPEFGNTTDDNQLEEILYDIRWANSGGGERLRATLAVTAGEEYKIQILISANGQEDRRWDIRVNGREAVDEITSLGVSPGASYSARRATLFTYQFVPTTAAITIEMGHLFGSNDGGDRNPIWQALTVERVFIPPTPDDIALDSTTFFLGQTEAVGQLRVADRKSATTTHTLEFVPGEGSEDNAKFTLNGNALLPQPFDFATQAPGSVYRVRVRATDTSDNTRFLERTFSVALARSSPPAGPSADVASLSRFTQPGALLARLAAQDPDRADRLKFTLVPGDGGEDNAFFSVAGTELRLAQLFPAGATQARVRMRVTDLSGQTAEGAVVFQIQAPQVSINEVIASDLGGVPDEDAEPQEWIELRNHLPQYVDLTGFYLTDRPNESQRWKFPGGTLPPQGYVVIFADRLGTAPPGSTNLHANFSVGSSGETLRLTSADGTTMLSEIEAPQFFPGVAYGIGSGGSPGYLLTPTPGQPNGAVTEFGENAVSFSVPHGFYSKSFTVELGASVPGSTIRYTLDGSRPTATTGTIYAAPINIAPNTTSTTRGSRIVRALAIHPRAAYAGVATRTYLFVNGNLGPGVDGIVSQSQLTATIRNHATYGPLLDDALLALPAMSLVIPGGMATSERVGSLELLDPENREEGFQIDSGVKITGTSSQGSPKYSMSAKFRARYGRSSLRYPFFARGSMAPAGGADEFKELRLRSHSHDTFLWLATRENPPVPYGSPAVTRSGDAQLARGPWNDEMQLLMGQPGKRGRQVHMFVNGSYHGIYHIHEHPDEDFLASYYGGASEQYHWTGGRTTGSDHGGGDSWSIAWQNMKNNLGTMASARRWVDVTNLCDYMILSFYAGNDWDWSAQHNWAAAGPTLPDQGGWKFFEQDSDISLQDVNADSTDQDVPDGVFTAMMRLPDFRVLFRDRVYKHCFNDGMLTPAKAGALYNARMTEIATAIVVETARWQPSSTVGTLPWDRDQEWTNEWRYLRDTFFPQRTARLLTQFRARSGWWPIDPPAPSIAGGKVPAGTPITFTNRTGVVYVTTDGSDPRLPGGTINPNAQRLGSGAVETAVVSAGDTWRYLDDGTDPGPAWKTLAFDDSTWRSGRTEIGYGDGDETTTAQFVDANPATAGVQKNITTWFRKKFDVANFPSVQGVRLRLVRDDGAVVYLNGREVWRSAMPAGVITASTPASVGAGGADESAWSEVSLSLAEAGLKPVDNILAVEVHQQSPESSDISFNFELLASGLSTGTSLVVNGPTLLTARTFSANDWSAAVEVYLAPDNLPSASAANLIVSEIHYHPLDESANEFLEFLNSSTAPLDLSEVGLAGGITFRFPRATVLAAGERLVVAKDLELFNARYRTAGSPYFREGVRVAGPYSGSLSNDGETILVQAPDGTELFACAYGTRGRWPGRADGRGSSLELAAPGEAPLTGSEKSAWLAEPQRWRPSSEFHGSPGWAGSGPDDRLAINEILAASIPPETDAIELKNRTASALEIGGWFVSDSSEPFRKYRFPEGTRIEPGAWLVLREADFNNPVNPAALVPFALDSAGDDVFVVQSRADGALLRFADRVEFGPTPNGVVLGRFPDGIGPVQRLQAPTFGAANANPESGYETWAAANFPSGTPAVVMAPGADPDQDGLSNYAEYAFALPPLQPSAQPLAAATTQGSESFSFVYRVRAGATDLRYRIDVSLDLAAWDNTETQVETLSRIDQPDGSTRIVARLLPTPAGVPASRFVRLVAGP